MEEKKLKVCTLCREVKDINEFHHDRKRIDGRVFRCRSCCAAFAKIYNANPRRKIKHASLTRARHLKSRFKLSPEDFQKMVDEQDNKCKICNSAPTIASRGKYNILYIDHCHKSGKIRGLLCHPCNVALGLLKEDINIMKSAIEYLLIHSERLTKNEQQA